MQAWLKTCGLILRIVRRDLRHGWARLTLAAGLVSSCVAALVVIDVVCDRAGIAVWEQGKRSLGADIELTYRGSLPSLHQRYIDSVAAAQTVVYENPGVARIRDSNELVPVVATTIERAYPLFGELEPTPASARQQIHGASAPVIVERALAEELGVAVGGEIMVEGSACQIAGIAETWVGIGLGSDERPRVYFGAPDGKGGRPAPAQASLRRLQIKLGDHADRVEVVARLKDWYAGSGVTMETADELQVRYFGIIVTVRNVLRLVALLGVLVGSVGMGNALKAYVDARSNDASTMLVLGLPRTATTAVFTLELFLVCLVGNLVGAGTGGLLAEHLLPLLRDLVPSLGGDGSSLRHVAGNTAVGLLFSLSFTSFAVLSVYRISATRSFRRAEEPSPADRFRIVPPLLCAAVAFGYTYQQTEEVKSAAALIGLLAFSAMVQYVVHATISRSAQGTWAARLPLALRMPLLSFARRKREVVLCLVCVGAAVFLVVTLKLTESVFRARIDREHYAVVPNAVIAGIRAADESRFRRDAARFEARLLDSAPLVAVRVLSLPGGLQATGEQHWGTYRPASAPKPPGFPPDYEGGTAEIVVEPRGEFASVPLGAIVEIEVQGVPVRARVVGQNEWEGWRRYLDATIRLPSALAEAAPHTVTYLAHVDRRRSESFKSHLRASYPGASLVNVGRTAAASAVVLKRILQLTGFVSSLTLLSCIMVYCVANYSLQAAKAKDRATMRMLGTSARSLAIWDGLETLLSSSIATAAGLFLGTAAGALIARWLLSLDAILPTAAQSVMLWAGTFGICIAVTLLSGFAPRRSSTRRV